MGDRYGIALFVNNLFDKAYTTSGSSSALTGDTLYWGNPRIGRKGQYSRASLA
jgi:outer membrane receptor protein involved in Fe transport